MISGTEIIFIIQKNDEPLYNSSLISGIIGIVGVFIGFWYQEKIVESRNYFASGLGLVPYYGI